MKKKIYLLLIGCLVLLLCACEKEDLVEKDDYTKSLVLVGEYPHSRDIFTEAFFVANDKLYETGGRYGESVLVRYTEKNDGTEELRHELPSEIFAEGTCMLDESLYMLTYKESLAFQMDVKNFSTVKEYSYPRDGWGLTTDGTYLIASDGSSTLYYMDTAWNDIKQVTVTLNGEEQDMLNELEYIDGYIWANIFLSDTVVVIDAETGKIVKMIDFSELSEKARMDDRNSVLNGIAWNEETQMLYLTGKNFDRLFAFKLK